MAAPAQQALPEVQEILQGGSLTPADAAGWSLEDVWQALGNLIGENLHLPLQFAVQAVLYLLVACVLGLLAGSPGWRSCVDAVAVLGFGALSLQAMMDLTRSVCSTAQNCQSYLATFVPVYSGVAIMGGQTAGGAVYSGMFFAMSGFLAALTEKVLLPVMQIYFCFSACAAVWGNPGIEEAAALFARCLAWLLKGCGVLFSVVLGLQNVLAGAVDNAAIKAGRGVLQGFVPVVGDAAAAALSSAAAAVQLLKGSLALAAVLALGAAFAPVLLHCLLYCAAFLAAGIVAAGTGQKRCGQLCQLYAKGARLCSSILTLTFFMVFLSTALLLLMGNGG